MLKDPAPNHRLPRAITASWRRSWKVISAFTLAYSFGRRHSNNSQFTFGTGKVGVLGGFSSAIVLAGIAMLMAAESIHRLIAPAAIQFREAIVTDCVGLIVNVVCAWILKDDPHHHHHGHGHDHAHEGRHHDLNLRAA